MQNTRNQTLTQVIYITNFLNVKLQYNRSLNFSNTTPPQSLVLDIFIPFLRYSINIEIRITSSCLSFDFFEEVILNPLY